MSSLATEGQTSAQKTNGLRPGNKRLILCFDGTGNSFQGNPSDTNIVKLLDMFNRSAPDQMHYYQPGIGTYTTDGSSVNQTYFGQFKSKISKTLDSGLATSFDAHVIAGYRFLMRYYNTGDKIYLFGFSRGAFTARFLARMVSHVGLLSMGNEEMVPFAYKVYQDYEMSKACDGNAQKNAKAGAKVPATNGDINELNTDSNFKNQKRNGTAGHANCRHGDKGKLRAQKVKRCTCEHCRTLDYMTVFRSTFCRHEIDPNNQPEGDTQAQEPHVVPQAGIKVHFLGLFDTVSSVGTFDFKGSANPPSVHGTAQHVRHAVAIDERRVKFKAALLKQNNPAKDSETSDKDEEDVKEVWFPGNHGDIGGGWPADTEQLLSKLTWKQWFKRIFTGDSDKSVSVDKCDDVFQLSDIALKWMIEELDSKDVVKVEWNKENKNCFEERYNGRRNLDDQQHESQTLCTQEQDYQHERQIVRARMHDTMSFGGGSSFFKVIMWKLMEYLPIIRRLEYNGEKWEYQRFPLNRGNCRDIPHDALFHHSVVERMRDATMNYRPGNDVHITKDMKFDLHGALERVTPPTARHRLLKDGIPYFVRSNRETKTEGVVCSDGHENCKKDHIYRLAANGE
ncbi:MAG: hypothetical protein Q9227_008053 [Pyrenula ochraceoflavens]